ncbi:Endonuclease/exonuclease/phosphatase [Parasitella parasitica]|nr:Endonuclease/exonuclease/phosphatase [Parasitella parasitica]
MALVPGYHAYFSFSKVKLGYSGVAVYVKDTVMQPRRIYEGITGVLDTDNDFVYDLGTPAKILDDEGRCIILDFGFFALLNIYFPNDSNETRIDFKMDYHHCVQKRIESFLNHGKQVLLVGDINAVHEEIDHFDAKQSMKDNNIFDFKDLPHRRWLDNMIDPKGPLIDMARLYHPNRSKMYTCWNTRLNARHVTCTRIDYILASKGLKPWFKYADIQSDIFGSDHCPVYADFLQINQDIQDHHAPFYTSPLLTSNFSEFKQKKLSNQQQDFDLNALVEEAQEKQVTAKAWTSIFKAPAIPTCTFHKQPCVEIIVSKKGPNTGRVFYICSRPTEPKDGPNDEHSCDFFQWK